MTAPGAALDSVEVFWWTFLGSNDLLYNSTMSSLNVPGDIMCLLIFILKVYVN